MPLCIAQIMRRIKASHPCALFFVMYILSCILSSNVISQESDSWPYIGEYTEYDLSYFGIPASKIYFNVVDTVRLESALAFQLRVTTKTAGLWSKLFKLNNIYESTIDYFNVLPLKYYKKIDQKNIQQEWSIDFDQSNHIAKIDSEKTWSIPASCHNFFSMIYAIRHKDFATLDTAVFYLDVESIVWRVRLRNVGRETIRLPAGEYNAIRFSLDFIALEKGKKRAWKTDLLTNRLAKEDSESSIWFSDDRFKRLLKIHYKFSVFSLKVQVHKIIRTK